MSDINVLFAFGTRPEAIKLAPVIKRLQAAEGFHVGICLTSQHKELLRQVTEFFDIREDIDLDVMVHNQTLEHITSAVLTRMRDVFEHLSPDIILVQGDTTTVFAAALAAYYHRVAVGHVEAGLRTFNKYSPFPEEMNRRLTGALTDLHFAPTKGAAANLRAEGVTDSDIFVTGNTVVDALHRGLGILGGWPEEKRNELLVSAGLEAPLIDRVVNGRTRLITVTAHRRESFGGPFEHLCRAIRTVVERYPDVDVIYPVHPNPNVREVVGRILSGHPRIALIEPVGYSQLLFLMERSYLLLTDSGGIQEEGPSLRKPVLVMREVTERPEGVEAGVAKLVGTDTGVIVGEASRLLDDPSAYDAMASGINPYGDGRASERIESIIRERLRNSNG
jgi:UDP-N-acetylglucosamine 2-epimerase (non-hydrolysing)